MGTLTKNLQPSLFHHSSRAVKYNLKTLDQNFAKEESQDLIPVYLGSATHQLESLNLSLSLN